MIVFVSYARRDNDMTALQRTERLLRFLGQPYIDDLHHHTHGTDRHEIVEEALRKAIAFVAVASPHYLQTYWTRKEFGLALGRGIPISALLPSGTLVGLRSGDSSRSPGEYLRRAALLSAPSAAAGSVGRVVIAHGFNPAVVHGPSG